MTRETFPISTILVEDRQRIDLGDIEGLMRSLTRFGLIQPIVLNDDNKLIAGGRRLEAARRLGWTEILVCRRSTFSDADLRELELEENIRRKSMSWQEECRGIAKAHYARLNASVKQGDFNWTQARTGEMLGLSVGNVNYCLDIAKRLDDEGKSAYWQCDSLAEAWRLRLREEENKILAEIARREQTQTNTKEQEHVSRVAVEQVRAVAEAPELLVSERARYTANPFNTIPFEEYWAEKVTLASEADRVIYISNKFICGDSITYMNDPDNEGRFDHVITDIPYGIDMEMLDQQNPHGGMLDLDTVIQEHDVDDNKALIAKFFPAAFRVTKPNAFVVTWCDQMLWQYMYDLAVSAGFKVQRWPITWIKTSSCMNQCAQFNFTKNTEIAMVCRKPSATLIKPAASCVVSASNEEMKRLTGHPFAKPFEAWQKIVEHVSLEGQSILEPFAGRGSGVLSMLKMKRHVVGVELQVEHFNALLENVKTQHYLKLNPNYIFK